VHTRNGDLKPLDQSPDKTKGKITLGDIPGKIAVGNIA
jgi:hypothetical protein